MAPTTLTLKDGPDVFQLSYSVDFAPGPEHASAEDSSIVVPDSTVMVSFQIRLNGHALGSETDAAQNLYTQLQTSPLWPLLMFTPVDGQAGSGESAGTAHAHRGLQLFLRCDLFNPMLPDLAVSRGHRRLRALHLALDYFSPHRTVPYATLAHSAQYMLTSLVLNLEYKYPFVFSYYGKQVTRINYRNMVKNTTSFATPLETPDFVPAHGEIVALVLAKLHRAILCEFNTVNVMKECDVHAHRARSCRQSGGLSAAQRAGRSVKAQAVDLRPLEED